MRIMPHQLTAMVTAMLFVISLAAGGIVGTGAALKMWQAGATEAQSSDPAMDCCADRQAPPAACVVACATAIAILCDSADIAMASLSQRFEIGIENPLSGYGVSPEPDPPRPISMS